MDPPIIVIADGYTIEQKGHTVIARTPERIVWLYTVDTPERAELSVHTFDAATGEPLSQMNLFKLVEKRR